MTPLLMYPADAAELRGASVHHHWWTKVDPQDPDKAQASAEADLPELFARQAPGTLVIAKSLGSCAAPYVATRALPAIWLTPMLTNNTVIKGLGEATAPFMLIGGTADGHWDGPLAHDLTPHVFEVEGADHGMYVEGPLSASLAVLNDVVVAVERFLDEVVWP